MTDREVMDHPSVAKLVRALEAADRALAAASEATGRSLSVFAGCGDIVVIDRGRFTRYGATGTGIADNAEGCIVAWPDVSGGWDGGDI